jgi:uncharacterized protein (TIGR00251 family)
MILRVKVIPKSSRTQVEGPLPDGSWKVKVTAPPEKGKANAAVCAALAERLGVPPSAVEVVAGATASWKQVAITDSALQSRPRKST